ncbi:AsmA family protein (plasmid) [Aliisedimentitalea scapharcae]|uniref:AsmA family protein n=1 Tax=Aliisedimentitalea scapharcae TaxID=1524259 RepID=A0ABZ2Y090_9RHOB
MQHWGKRILALTLGLSIFLVVLVWLVLSSSILAGPRGQLTEWILNKKIGQNVQIQGGVLIELGQVLNISAQGVTLPSPTLDDINLAEISQLNFSLVLADLLKGKIDLLNLGVDGVTFNLIAKEDGTTSWAPASKSVKPNAPSKPRQVTGISGLVSDHKLQITNAEIVYRDGRNGLDLNLLMPELAITREDTSEPVQLRGNGDLNGQGFTLSGEFHPDAPSGLELAFDSMRVRIDAKPDDGGFLAGFQATADATIDDLGQLQDVLKLNKVVSGTGKAGAEIIHKDGKTFVGGADLVVSLTGGQSVVVKRSLGPTGNPANAVLDTTIRLYPENAEPPKTALRRDLKLVSVFMQLANRDGDIPLRKMVIETNGFVMDTGGEGPPPIAVSDISRTPDGLLAIGDATLRLGPPDAPLVVLQGAISDALQVKGIDIGGTLSLPTASLLSPELFQTSDILGTVTGGFRLTGSLDGLMLSDLNAATQDTDLWHLTAKGSVGDILTLNQIAVDLSADIVSGAETLGALGLEPIDTGPLTIAAKLNSQGPDWQSNASVSVADSQLGFNVTLDAEDPNAIVRGRIESELIQMADIRTLIAAAMQVSRIAKLEDAAKQNSAPTDDKTVDEDAPSETQPPPGPFRDLTLLPLGRSILLSGMDLEVAIDLQEVVGERGKSSLKSDLELKGGKMRLGPMTFDYAGGSFEVTGSMDLDENPDIVNVSGSTGGWDLGKIMHALHFKNGVSGVLNASFDVSGNHASGKDFLKSLKGWSTISLSNGTIDTQLLDIAGLGVIPWLFTKNKGDRAPIVCMNAPLQISNGTISSKRIVVETDDVQVVVYGSANLSNKSLDIHGQPRKIGKPLSRSPWPFSLSGAMSKPKVKVKDGPRKLRRKDGASTMPKNRKRCVPDILQLQ